MTWVPEDREIIPCLSCTKPFPSKDKASNKICPACDAKNGTYSKRESQSTGRIAYTIPESGDPTINDLL